MPVGHERGAPRRAHVLVLAVLVVATVTPNAPGAGASSPRLPAQATPPLVAAPAGQDRAGGEAEPGSYLVQLHGEPLARTSARWKASAGEGQSPTTDGLRGATVAAQRTAIDREQDVAAARIVLTAPTANVVRRLRVAWNGLEVTASPQDALRLRNAGFQLRPNPRVEAFLSTSVPQVRANEVWSRTGANGLALTGQGVRIAVLDTGVDYTHSDLGGCLGTACKVAGGWDVVNQDADPRDDNGHGTHVAATVGGSGTYNGVAPGASIYAYKVLSAQASGSVGQILEGLDRAVDPNRDGDTTDGASVVNVSLGCVDWGQCTPDDPLSTAVDNIVSDGAVVVAASGNSGWVGVASPASARAAIAVGASDGVSGTASFSGEGPVSWEDRLLGKPDLVAPGVGVCAARWAAFAPDKVCHAGGRHVRLTGSSMAAPHVAGAAALLLQARPGLSPAQVRSLLRATARQIPEFNNSGTNLGAGLLDVRAAVDAAAVSVPTVELQPLSATQWPKEVRAHVDAVDVTAWRLEAGGLHKPSWSLVAGGTALPADGVFHVFSEPVYSSPGPRLRLTVETAAGARGVDFSWLPIHADYSTPVLTAGATGIAHNGWDNGARALASDEQHAEALDDPNASTIGIDYSMDAGSTWHAVSDAVQLPSSLDQRVLSATPPPAAAPASAFARDTFRLRLRSATGLALQDFGSFDLHIPADARVTRVLVYVEGHTRQTSDPLLGQAVTATRRVDDVGVRIQYRLASAGVRGFSSASYARIASAPVCELSCHSQPQVAVRSDGRPVVAYRDIANDSLMLMVCGDLDCRAGNTYTSVDGAAGCPAGCGPERNGFPSVSLALRADDRPVIAYVSNNAPTDPYSRDLRLVTCGDRTCSAGNTYVRLDISKLEPEPPPKCILIVCEPGDPLPPRTSVGTATLTLNANGIPVLVFAARARDGEDTAVRVLTCTSPTCQSGFAAATIEGPGCTGLCDAKSEVVWPISLGFRPDGRPVLAYQQQYTWSGTARVSAARIKMVTCGDTRCSVGNTYTPVAPHTGYAPVLRLQRNGLPTLTFLAGSVPQPLVLTCRTPTCAGPMGGDQIYSTTALDGWGTCAPGCNPRTSHAFHHAMTLDGVGAPVIALYDEHASSLKLIRCVDAQCAHATTFSHLDGAASCPAGCDPHGITGDNTAIVRRASDGAFVVAYRDLSNHSLKIAVARY